MLLVFVFSATFCIQAFVLSNQISKESQIKDQAVNYAQTMVETLIKTNGDLKEIKQVFGGKIENGEWKVCLNEEWEESDKATFYVWIKDKQAKDYLGQANVMIQNQEGYILYEQNIAWQEEVFCE